ncbi:YL1 nuclear protein-domain-containing protein [Crucibulum laeve]|uniref:YL1 nuclear protein-domain-containing protein n=1 Tax=Crucibulum laeve TaxID=68775 RepID=A0A5C3LZX5_9AGAR|nr:YL1 nuclear protein-domain-containing protein [Crucibulum laeve]
MAEPVELLATRRPKRATAGNRMAEALAEMALDEFNKDLDDDNDFVNDKDEEDVFESDFASTDEEAQQEGVDGGEKEVHDEEKQARKAARSRLERATAAAHAKNKATFNPNTSTSASTSKPKPPKKPRKRLTLDTDSDDGGDGRKGTKRKSKRVHTVQNTLVTTTRMKESEKKKASAPRKAKPAPTLAPTQAELIMAALENEEGNIVEHRDYLKIEEEKRLRATRVTRQVVQGPLVRWISRAEDVKVVVESPVPPAPTPLLPPTTPATLATPVPATTTTPTTPATTSYQPSSSSPYTYTLGKYPTLPHFSPQYAIPQPTVPLPPPEPERTEKQGKNYIIHELTQSDSASRKPAWKDTMTALFGDHVKWDEVKVHSGKGRPMSRPVQICAITGLPARYLDQRSGVPFADVRAYRVLTGLLQHEYIWNQQLGCYVGREERREVPNEMDVDED